MNKDPATPPPGAPDNTPEVPIGPALDGNATLPFWLQSQLTQMYSQVMKEPLPPELLDLVRKLEEGPGGRVDAEQ